MKDHPDQRGGVTRRSFLQTVGLSAAAASAQAGAARLIEKQAVGEASDQFGPDPASITLTINGRDHTITIDPATTLMEVLRWHLDLTGTKEICDRGACGGCSVLVDGRLIVSCMMLAHDAQGRQITTIEGLAEGDRLDSIQEAFIRHDALQCGYCTPGLIMAAKALLSENPRPSYEQIRRGLSGNLCRCGTYSNVFNAVLDASGQPPLKEGSNA